MKNSLIDALVRENILSRLEYVLFALYQVLPCASWDSESFLQELSRKFRLLVLEWSGGLSSSTQCRGFSALTNDELDTYVRQFIEQQGSMVGCSILSGYLRSLGLRIQRDRFRASIARVVPSNVRTRWAAVFYRRYYSVPGPNSLWHLDGHHSLVNWGFLVHGGIDRFSRLIVFLKCSTNTKSDTMRYLFLAATE